MASTLTMSRGDNRLFDSTVDHTKLGSGGLTGYNARFMAKRDRSDTNAAAVITKAGAGQCAVTTVGSTTVDGIVTTTLLPADTTGLPGQYPTLLQWDVELTDGSGVVTTVDSGTLVVSPDAAQ